FLANTCRFSFLPLSLTGKTGEVVKTGNFNMYNGDVEELIDFLLSIEQGSAVLMASFDDPATKLNHEARELIGALGSSASRSLAFRDNWVFVGGKGIKTSFEKHLKYNKLNDKYDGWPAMIELEGCIPKYQD
uniref:Zgc:101783 n=1 Tax=Myripristis murdjan TaxID=586833 RepID=A0A668A3U1_9TELE